jgi:hypothetical protein
MTDMITFKEFRQKTDQILFFIYEESTFYIYRTDTNAVLARGIQGFEAAKARANQIRKTQNLKWDQVKFKSERGLQGAARGSTTTSGRDSQFGVSSGGKTFTNAYGKRYPIEYSRNYNPSKGRRFRGYTDADGNYHDID